MVIVIGVAVAVVMAVVVVAAAVMAPGKGSGENPKKSFSQRKGKSLLEFLMRNRMCNKIPPEVTCRVTCGVRMQRG